LKLYEEVYEYWFGKGSLTDPSYMQQRMKLWFSKDPKVDNEMRERFGSWLTEPPDPALQKWKVARKGTIALVVLHDQFPRNIHRGTAKMFAWDGFALQTAREALSHGIHESVNIFEAMFLILPFEHSEKLADQEESVQLFSDLRNRCPREMQSFGDEILNYAVRHMDIIERFGRFPHRNAVLGRTSTREEKEFLESPGSGF
jgi:uncharacterized protein (DUF924 family)